MNILQAHLDDREGHRQDVDDADRRWLYERGGVDPAERLQKWDSWLVRTLLTTLCWPANNAVRDRLVRQCAAEITVMVRHLAGRGWLLDGEALAAHVQAVLKPIAQAQKAGKIADFYPYFRASVFRYVGANAEEIQHHARRTGTDEGARTVGDILSGLRIRGATMTELLAQRAGEIAQAKAERLHLRKAVIRTKKAQDPKQRLLF